MKKLSLLVAGTYQESDAYPNVKYRLRLFDQFSDCLVTRLHRPLNTRIDYSSHVSIGLSILRIVASALYGSVFIVYQILRNRHYDVLYLPYPAILLLWIISFLPRHLLPDRIVVDLFISIYDTVVIDRGLIPRRGVLARLLLAFERRALKLATVLITDTPENTDYYCSIFSLNRASFVDIPLSIDNTTFCPKPDSHESGQGEKATFTDGQILTKSEIKFVEQDSSPMLQGQSVFRVLYVGTLVPLHNIPLLCELVLTTNANRPVEFVFVGNGQDAPILKRLMDERDRWPINVNCVWIRDWQNSLQIASHIRSADVCIGILGTHGKSQRVWPIKNYLYMACGKPVITACTDVSERLATQAGNTPFLSVSTTSLGELQRVLDIALKNPESMYKLALSARRFHSRFHADSPVAGLLETVLRKQFEQSAEDMM